MTLGGIDGFSAKQWDVANIIYYGEVQRPIILFGGAGFGGKSHLAREILVNHNVYLRQFHGVHAPRTYIACRELQDVIKRHAIPLQRHYRHMGTVKTSGPNPGFHFHNPEFGIIEFWHLKDTDSFRSNEFYAGVVDEASENRRQCKASEGTLINDLMYPIRAGDMDDVPMFLLLCSNPDGPGHGWLKKMFVTKEDTQGYEPERIFYIAATVDDNPNERAAAMQARELEQIENESVRMARRYGSWDFPEGLRFNFDKTKHTFKMAERFPMGLPRNGQKFIGYDWGLGAPFCSLWAWREPGTGDVYFYRGVYKKGLTIGAQAKMILAYTMEDEIVKKVFADETIFLQNQWTAREGNLQRTVAEDLQGVLRGNRNIGPVVPASVRDRAGGFSKIDSYLDQDMTTVPNMYIEEDACSCLIDEIEDAAYDRKDASSGDIDDACADHALTACYFLLRSLSNVPMEERPDDVPLPPHEKLMELRRKIQMEKAKQQAMPKKRAF